MGQGRAGVELSWAGPVAGRWRAQPRAQLPLNRQGQPVQAALTRVALQLRHLLLHALPVLYLGHIQLPAAREPVKQPGARRRGGCDHGARPPGRQLNQQLSGVRRRANLGADRQDLRRAW